MIDIHSANEQTPEICLAAVQQNGFALQYVKKQTPELCLMAVQQNGNSLQYVKKQTHEICLAAVQQSEDALQYIKLPYKKVFRPFDDCHQLCEPLKENTCCICYNDIYHEYKKVVGCLQCKQPFHDTCLRYWFHTSKNVSCPACKDTNWKRKVDIQFIFI